MSFVVDSSVTLSWCFEDERTSAATALLHQVAQEGALAPQHWPLEVLNGLLMAERRKRISAKIREELAGFLRDLPITLDNETVPQTWEAAQTLALQYRLTIYDACYLELAHRKRLALATTDKELRKAAKSLHVPLLGT